MRLRLAALISLLVVLCGLVACGSYSSPATTASSVTPGAASTTLISIGDSPADNILSFEITVNSVVLTDTNGGSVTVVNKPFRIELTHLAGTFVPVASFNVPQGTYARVAVTFSSPELVLLNADGSTSELEPPLAAATGIFNFSPALAIGGAATALNLDFNVSSSVSLDNSGKLTVNPTIAVTSGTAAAGQNRLENGRIEDARGTIASVGSDTFSVGIHDGTQTLSFKIDSTTIFRDISGLAALKQGMQVEVDARLQADGSLLATKVEAEGAEQENEQEMRNAMELEGVIVDIAGNPPTQISLVVRDASSGSSNMPALGNTVQIEVTANTKFEINSNSPLDSLPFTPVFGRDNMSKGQNVEVDADGSSNQPIPARKISLHDQSLTGTVSAIQTGPVTSFTLTLPAGSAFANLSGMQAITIYQLSSTEQNGVAVAEGNTVRVRGLLFVDGGTLKMVARRISQP